MHLHFSGFLFFYLHPFYFFMPHHQLGEIRTHIFTWSSLPVFTVYVSYDNHMSYAGWHIHFGIWKIICRKQFGRNIRIQIGKGTVKVLSLGIGLKLNSMNDECYNSILVANIIILTPSIFTPVKGTPLVDLNWRYIQTVQRHVLHQ